MIDINEHVESSRFKKPVKDQIGSIGEEFYFELDDTEKVRRLVYRGSYAEPFEFEY
jgi:hypothetical protein